MTTITIHRDAPVSTFPPNTTVTISHLPKTWSWSDIVEMMPTSLSGEKGDYDWEYNESTATLSIASKHSYQQRFHSKQVDFNDQKVELTTLEDNFKKKVLSDEYLADVLMKVQLYTSLGRGASLNQDNSNANIYIFTTLAVLHDSWFWQLPRYIRSGLYKAQLFNRMFTFCLFLVYLLKFCL